MRFDGREFAREVEERVKAEVRVMAKKPKIVSVLVGNNPASELYTRLKLEAARRVGINFVIHKIDSKQLTANSIWEEVLRIGKQEGVTGVMVQMPIPGLTRVEQQEVVKAIPLDKDVDGLRWQESGIMPATVKAILSILDKIAENSKFEIRNSKIVVVGSHGSVGKPLIYFLAKRGVKTITEVNSQTEGKEKILQSGEIVVSCVGKKGVITGEMVSEGVIAVDVGSPRGDMTAEVYAKATAAVPVPGGVGPVTIACLMENAILVR